MIDPNTIEEFEETDGEAVHCYGLNTETEEYGWGWVPVETLIEAGRGDLLPWLSDAA